MYAINNAINYYLSENSISVRYKNTSVAKYTEEEFRDLVLKNIMNDHPVQPVINVTDMTYFPYITEGHYVVIAGMQYDAASSSYNAIIHDPHDKHCATYTVPLSAILSYNQAHKGGELILYVDG